jgi:signal transduction histidine kinase
MEYERIKGIKEKGTGLGLPLAKKLIELNKGKMWFESEVEKGTTFYLLFKKASGNEINS